jgi:hypothetical protein
MSPRAPHIQLPTRYVNAVGQVVVDSSASAPRRLSPGDPAYALPRLVERVLDQALILADPITPRSATHALVYFRTALDVLADYLTRWYGCRDGAEVIPPCTYSAELQSVIIQIAEVTLQAQVWDEQIPEGELVPQFAPSLLATLRRVSEQLGRLPSPPLNNATTSTITAVPEGNSPLLQCQSFTPAGVLTAVSQFVTATPNPRLTTRDETRSVILDGRRFCIGDPLTFKLFAALVILDYARETPVSARALFQEAKAGRPSDARPGRAFERHLPVRLRALIKIKPGSGGGRYLDLPRLVS